MVLTVKDKLKSTFEAIKMTLKSRKHLLITIIFGLFMIGLAIYIPSLITPGNTIEFQLSLITFENALIMVLFSSLVGLSMGMHAYASDLLKRTNVNMVIEEAGTGIVGMFSTMLSGPLCASCIAIIFSAVGLGSGAALFVLVHIKEIQIISLALILLSIYLAGKRVNRNCELCKK